MHAAFAVALQAKRRDSTASQLYVAQPRLVSAVRSYLPARCEKQGLTIATTRSSNSRQHAAD